MVVNAGSGATNLSKLEGKNWIATLLFAWFLGGLGAHRFYTGKSGSAWAMAIMTLTVCLAPISWIWAIVDGCQIALGHWTHEDGSQLFERINWLGIVYIVWQILLILYIIFNIVVNIALVAAMLGGGAGAGY